MQRKRDHWNPTIYHQCSQMQFAVAKQFINQSLFSGTEQALDIGCGDGKTSLYLAKKLAQGRLLAIDHSVRMIEFAKKHYRHKNLSYQLMDAQYLSLINCFDVITSFFCLPWIQNKQDTFHNMARCLRSKGKILLITTFFSEEQKALIYQIIKKPYWRPYFRNHPDPFDRLNDLNYAYYAFCSGIQLTSSVKEAVQYTFPDPETLKKFFTLLIPHTHYLEETTKQQAFVEDIYKSYQQICMRNDNTIDFKIIKMIGYKDH